MTMRIILDADAFEQLDAIADEYIADSVLPNAVKRAKRIVPVDTHKLQESIHAESSDEGHFLVADTDYAAHVEEGTSKMAAQPYLRPAITSSLPRKKKAS